MEQITYRNGYKIFREIVDGKGVWYAQKDGGELISITYNQALGYDPLGELEALQMQLGKMLLPR